MTEFARLRDLLEEAYEEVRRLEAELEGTRKWLDIAIEKAQRLEAERND